MATIEELKNNPQAMREFDKIVLALYGLIRDYKKLRREQGTQPSKEDFSALLQRKVERGIIPDKFADLLVELYY